MGGQVNIMDEAESHIVICLIFRLLFWIYEAMRCHEALSLNIY